MATKSESYEFKSEARQLLELMIHSLYSNKEIFLRELISNSSDALDKLRFEAIGTPDLLDEDRPLGIRINTDPKTRTFEISDNGIGMTREELIENLGTIAKSGTREFSEKISDSDSKADVDALIGQFGVGFYSSFMAASEVEVVSRHATEEQATKWSSSGDGSFEVSDANRDAPGTTITLTLREADPENGLEDFTQEWVIKQTVKRYSDFVQYPIELEVTRTEIERDDDGQPVEGAEEQTIIEWQTVNSMKAIWTRTPSDVSDEEYAEFYKHLARDWEDPFERISFKVEGTFEYQALLFIPGRAPHDMFYRDQKYGLQLYVNRVLIKEAADELLPEWLRFVKGVVDSPDLSLNVSREILQNDRRVAAIRKRICKKVVDQLKALKNDENRDKYKTFWENYGQVIKEGSTDSDFKDSVQDLLWFQSSNAESGYTSLAEYVERMADGQDAIYYITGPNRTAVENSPHLEAFRAKGIEVLYLVDPIDEIIIGHIPEFQEKKLQSASKGDVELGSDEERKAAEETKKEKSEAHAPLLDKLQAALDAHIKEVRFSSRLTNSAACLVGEEFDMTPGLERLLKQSGQDVPVQKRILEINPEHAVLGKLKGLFDADSDDPKLADYAHLLHGQALIAEGSSLPDPASFAQRVTELMVQ
ncbi:MAG: molecular chaperone HtpG [Myxococcales bacterium]|nr:molecular chaperone HtpG [Myxococcales bacterium]|tara:strand:+ start:769 stop:2712 length:1944 start_codon:yes stop_codon:yes gene_type:complete